MDWDWLDFACGCGFATGVSFAGIIIWSAFKSASCFPSDAEMNQGDLLDSRSRGYDPPTSSFDDFDDFEGI